MPLYRYIAAAKNEDAREILIEADSPSEAIGKLRGRKLVPVKFCGEEGASSAFSSGSFSFSMKRSKIDTYEFTRQLAPLLNSFIPLERALGIIAESSAAEEQKNFVSSLRQGLHEGKKFSALVRSHGRLFPDYYANLIESGEETGCLPEVLNHLYQFMLESKEQRDFIVSSSIYPLSILAVTLLVSVLLFTVFVPKFEKIFLDMGRELPASMNFLLGVSAFFSWAWWLLPLLGFLGFLALKQFLGAEELRRRFYKFVLSAPLFGRIAADVEMCKYVRTLSIMIANHVEIIRTVGIAGKVIHNPVIAQDFKDIAVKLKGGQKLSNALSGNRFIPKEMVPMLRVGEESGTLGEMLTKIAENLESDTRIRIKRLLSLFEPAVIIFLAVIVLIVVASIFVSMMEINAIA